ncbi:unnamed protein product [Fusarium graminearum]|nr:unnamed protein product [Fusarium graminearum]
MTLIMHNIDPSGDLVVVLKKPNKYRVIPEVWINGEKTRGHVDRTDVETPKMPTGLGDSDVQMTEIEFRVSSKHLKLASVVFDKMLSGPWKEANCTSSLPASEAEGQDMMELTGYADTFIGSIFDLSLPIPAVPVASDYWEISTTGWHAHAFRVVLEVIHGQLRNFPEKVSLEFFTHVAVIANYYHCTEAVSLAARFWRVWNKDIPTSYGKRSIMWLYISWVFSMPITFSNMLGLAVKDGLDLFNITTHDLPVATVLETAEAKRKKAILCLITELAAIERKLIYGQLGCSQKCRSMMIGSLALEKQKNPHLVLKGENDCRSRISLSRVIHAVNSFGPIEWIDPASRFNGAHMCNVTQLMQPVIESVLQVTKLLQLSDFKK